MMFSIIFDCLKLSCAVCLAIAVGGCGTNRFDNRVPPLKGNDAKAENAIYYWRTTFAPDSVERAFVQHHNIERIYLRMFDVVTEFDRLRNKTNVVPTATTRFEGKVPDGVEIVPTAYITVEAMREIGKENAKEYAELIVERMRAMANYNGCGKVYEMQFDCDWTSSTRKAFFSLCREACVLLHRDSIALSATIRLHQLREAVPPVDRGVLMLYNTGALKSKDTRNSILDIRDVRAYLRKATRYTLPLAYAYPAFGWGVKFSGDKFDAIVSNPAMQTLVEGETIRVERPNAEEVLEVKHLVDLLLGSPASGNVIYHLDKEQLKYLTDDEIDEIYACH